jgi:hypothetical protein
MATYQARLATFEGAATTKSRRSSTKSKKAPKAKAAWPLSAPSAQDLAYSGFVWKPTSASPDNVQCWACNCQLDGWEDEDVPAFEHLTHSPSCGFAIVTAIRLRHGDPGRTEEDPTSDFMIAARQATFGDLWPLDPAAGYPSVQQLATAGWFYDPTGDTPDGVCCPYCHLALDAWDAGDDPFEEHRRRAPDCLFFALKELYHPTKPVAKAKRGPKTKRISNSSSTISSVASTTAPKKKTRSSTISNATSTVAPKKKTRSSTVSNATSTTAPTKKTRGKKRASDAMEDTTQLSEPIVDTKKARGRKRASEAIDDTTQLNEPLVDTKKTRGKKRTSDAMDDDTQLSEPVVDTKKTRGRKRASDAMEDTTEFSEALVEAKNTREEKRTSEVMGDATQLDEPLLDTKKTRGKKRTSDAMDGDTQLSESLPEISKRMRYSSMSSLPDDLPVGTPKKMPTEIDTEPFTMSSLPPSLLVGTPKRTPTHVRDAEDLENTAVWQPTDMDAFFSHQQDARGFMNEIIIDAGLDELTATGTTAAEIQAAVLAGLTDTERGMTVEQWILYNAKRGEEKLRMACEQQIMAFEKEGQRALALLEAVPTY